MLEDEEGGAKTSAIAPAQQADGGAAARGWNKYLAADVERRRAKEAGLGSSQEEEVEEGEEDEGEEGGEGEAAEEEMDWTLNEWGEKQSDDDDDGELYGILGDD